MHIDNRIERPKKSGKRRNLARDTRTFEQELQLSTCKAEIFLEIPHESIQRILRTDLRKKAYHI